MNLDYIVREPENISSDTTILFMLHGYGSNEQDLFSFRETLPKDWIIVSFRAPETPSLKAFHGMISILIILKILLMFRRLQNL
jgi:phospholipase/carboxylesterase